MSKIIRHADEPMTSEDREKLADLAAGGDGLQRLINEEALKHAGGKYVTVRRRRKGESQEWRDKGMKGIPLWVGCFVEDLEGDTLLTFAGIYVYGGATKREAIEDVDRLASKWGWGVIEP